MGDVWRYGEGYSVSSSYHFEVDESIGAVDVGEDAAVMVAFPDAGFKADGRAGHQALEVVSGGGS